MLCVWRSMEGNLYTVYITIGIISGTLHSDIICEYSIHTCGNGALKGSKSDCESVKMICSFLLQHDLKTNVLINAFITALVCS